MRIGRRMVAGVAVIGLGACGGTDADVEESEAPAAEAPAPASASAGVDDADIAAIVVVANTIDVRNGELARERATDERVREFAETMIRDHTAVNESAQELVGRLGVTPTMNDVTQSLEEADAEVRARLMDLSGAEFDRAYMAHEVEYHRTVIDALDGTLIPNATNAELRRALEEARPAFQAHLERAQSLLEELGG